MGPRWRISSSIFSRRDTASNSFFNRSPRNVVILRSAREHFYEVIVQAIIELTLQMPGELRMVEVAGVNRQHVGMNRDGRIFQIDQYFNGAMVLARRKEIGRAHV